MDSSDCVFSQTEPIKSYVIGQVEESWAEREPITGGELIAPPSARCLNDISRYESFLCLNSRSLFDVL